MKTWTPASKPSYPCTEYRSYGEQNRKYVDDMEMTVHRTHSISTLKLTVILYRRDSTIFLLLGNSDEYLEDRAVNCPSR